MGRWFIVWVTFLEKKRKLGSKAWLPWYTKQLMCAKNSKSRLRKKSKKHRLLSAYSCYVFQRRKRLNM